MSQKDENAAFTTTIRVRPKIWRALRQLAEDRSEAVGGRPSASAVIEELVTKASAERVNRADR